MRFHSKIPRSLKIAHTLYATALVPAYWWHYGPRNFLWFSDVALIGMAPALWREDRRSISTLASWTLLPEVPWNIGYFARLLTGRELFGLSHYMFDRRNPFWIRALSLFHLWLPPLLVWSVRRLGYDRHALKATIVAGEAVLGASYILAEAEENINWVYGPGQRAQTSMPAGLYFGAVTVFFPLFVWWPTHWILARLFGRSGPG